MSFPITVDPSAVEILKRIVRRFPEPEAYVRVGVKGGGCSGFEYVIRAEAKPRENDFVIDLDGVTLRCDPKSAALLDGATLRASGNLIGGGLTFDNPNADRSCGCGTSFMPKQARAS